MPKKLLVVTDINLKRLDSGVDFIYLFLKECAKKGVIVEYVLPVEPCGLVIEKLKEVDFRYIVLSGWRNRNDRTKRHNIKIALKLFRIIVEKKIDVVEFNFCYEFLVIIVAILIKLNFRNVVFIWRQHSEIISQKITGPVSLMKHNFSKIRILSLFVDFICPVFKGQEKILLERGVPKSKIRTIYNGINVDKFKCPPERGALLDELGVTDNGPIVVTIATLTPKKGISYLLNAAASVIKTIPKARFLIIGDGPLKEDLRSLSESLKISNNVYFLGNRSDVHKILSACDLFVLPSLSEAFGIVNIEAMAAQKAIIATKVGGIPEIILQGKNGFLVPPKNARALTDSIIYLLNDSNRRGKMGIAGRCIVEKYFTIDITIEQLFSIYCGVPNKENKEILSYA